MTGTRSRHNSSTSTVASWDDGPCSSFPPIDPSPPVQVPGFRALEPATVGMNTEATRVTRSHIFVVLVVAITGLGVQAFGYSLASAGHDQTAVPLLYAGFVLIFVPCAWRLLASNAARQERLQVSLLLGLLLLLSYYLRSPLIFDRFDELLHLATLRQLAIQHRYFTANSELPVSPYYPGLELVTLAVNRATGLPLVASQLLVLIGARVLLILGLFLILERLSDSAYIAGGGVLLYVVSPQFYAFNAGFAYQTLALPLALGIVYLILRELYSTHARDRRNLGLTIACFAALTITHHIVSFLTVGLLIVWAVALAWSRQLNAARRVGVIAAIGIALVAGWTAIVGAQLWRYLAPPIANAYDQVAGYLTGRYQPRHFFQEGVVTPAWERVLILLSAIGWCLLIAPAGWAVVKRRVLRDDPLRWVWLVVALSYPLLLAVRFSSEAAEIAERTSTFVFFPIVLIVSGWLVISHKLFRLRLTIGVVLVLFLGGLMLGSGPDWGLLPGPYLVAADQRSVDSVSLTAATWAADHLPEGSRIAADRTNATLLGSTGRLLPVTGLDGVNVTPIFFSHGFTSLDLSLMRSAHIQYFLVDYRLTEGLAYIGFYFESDPQYNGRRLTMEDLAKFNDTPGVRRVYHSSAISIFDVSRILHDPSPSLRTRPPAGGTLPANGWVLGLTLAVAAAWIRRALRRKQPLDADGFFRWLLAAICFMMLVGVILVPISISTHFVSIGVLVALLIWGLLPKRAALHARKERGPEFRSRAAFGGDQPQTTNS
jgi:hypothetical protein